ncbi:MAG: transposase [Solirubrobacteraceae bacterium]
MESIRFRGHSSAWAARPGREACPHATNPTSVSAELRRQAVELLRSGTPLKQVAAELDVSEQTLRNWRRQGDIDAGRAEGLTRDEREELRRLRREHRRLTQERAILKAAAAFFARETGRASR